MSDEVVRLNPGETARLFETREMSKVGSDEEKEKKAQLLKEVETLFGKRFFGQAKVESALNIKIATEDIPDIPFTEAELFRAYQLGQNCILRVDKTAQGESLTMEWLEENFKRNVKINSPKRFFDGGDWYRYEDFFTTHTPRMGWALVSDECVPNTKGQLFFDQVKLLSYYIESILFKDIDIPQEYREAISQIESEIKNLTKIDVFSQRRAARAFSKLKLNQLSLHTAVEVMYDYLLSPQIFKGNTIPTVTLATVKPFTDEIITFVCDRPGSNGVVLSGEWTHDFIGRCGIYVSRYK